MNVTIDYSMNYMKTEYPELYKQVYWGNFKYDDCFEKIIPRRNQFVTDYSIDIEKKVLKSVKRVMEELHMRSHRIFDHMEGYVTLNDSSIIFFSTYNIREKEQELVESYGFKHIDNLYVGHAKTFLVEIFDIRKFKRDIKENKK